MFVHVHTYTHIFMHAPCVCAGFQVKQSNNSNNPHHAYQVLSERF